MVFLISPVVIKLSVDLCLERRDHTEVGIVFYCIILFVILRLRCEIKSRVSILVIYQIGCEVKQLFLSPLRSGKCVIRVIDAHNA